MTAEPRTRPTELTAQQRAWVEAAWREVDEGTLVRLVCDLVNTPSPTGDEAAVAQLMVEQMRRLGLDAAYQPMSERRGNAIGRLHGAGGGPSLLFYGHLDTVFAGVVDEDRPVTGGQERRGLRPVAIVEKGHIAGLGASNPKGPAACEAIAAAAVARAGVPLKGSVIVGHVAGGSQKAQIDGAVRAYQGPRYQGQGVGCEHMLRQGVRADFAISAKPGYSVTWEEAGDCWFRVQVRGVVGDVTSRHTEAYRNPIVEATDVIRELEAWFAEYTARNTAGQIAPQATIGAVEGGWPFKPTFIPAICNLYLSLRTNPRTELMSVQRQLAAALDAIRARHPDLDLQCEMFLAVPGMMTDPESWIVGSCTRAWEAVEERPHLARTGLSYAPDSNTLRQWGIPTARLGLDRAKITAGERRPWLDATEVVSIDDMLRLVRCYVYAIVDTCTRDLAETGLAE